MSKFLDKHPRLKKAFNKNPAVADKVEDVLERFPKVDTALEGAAEEIEGTGIKKLAQEGGQEAAVGGVVGLMFGSAFLPAAAGAAATYVAYKGAKGAYNALRNKPPEPPQP